MKKYMMFASMLALTACHSGGGHHHNGAPIIDPVEPAIEMPNAVQKWNQTGSAYADSDKGTIGDRFTFNVDNDGNITSVLHDGRTYNRNGDKNEYVYTEPGKTRTMELATLGRDAGLTFADFGYAQETELEPNKTDRDFYVFTGGRNPTQNADVKGATFTGTAVAYVEADMPGRIANQVSKTNDAKLVVDANGNHELSMNFSKDTANPWYDVVVRDGSKFEFSNGDKVAAEFKIDGMTPKELYSGKQFYGANAEEVTYRVGGEYKDNRTGREVEFDAAFGGKR